jgi:hypothetical protein
MAKDFLKEPSTRYSQRRIRFATFPNEGVQLPDRAIASLSYRSDAGRTSFAIE